jgi:hypothetical protein
MTEAVRHRGRRRLRVLTCRMRAAGGLRNQEAALSLTSSHAGHQPMVVRKTPYASRTMASLIQFRELRADLETQRVTIRVEVRDTECCLYALSAVRVMMLRAQRMLNWRSARINMSRELGWPRDRLASKHALYYAKQVRVTSCCVCVGDKIAVAGPTTHLASRITKLSTTFSRTCGCQAQARCSRYLQATARAHTCAGGP